MPDDTALKPPPNDPERLAYRRLMCRRIGALIARAMADSDVGWDDMGVRIGVRPAALRRRMTRLMDGKTISLDDISDMLFACNGATLEISMGDKRAE